MSNNKLHLDGLEALRAELRNLPPAMQREAGVFVDEAASLAHSDVASVYSGHQKSGELQSKLTVERAPSAGRGFEGAIVRSGSKLAYIIENGTQVRHTAKGASRGSMKPLHAFIPAMIKRRAEMYDRIRTMMANHGLKVIG